MSDNLVKLLTQRFAIERRIHQIKNSDLMESKNAAAGAMLAKLETALAKVNEEYAVQQNVVPMEHGDHHPAPTHEPDHEVNMARSDLYRAGKTAMALEKMLRNIGEEQGLEGWVQAKITKAADYLESVYHYFDYEMHGNGEVEEAAAYGPGQNSTNPEAEENTMNQKPMALGGQQQPQAPGAPQQPQQLKPGQVSPTPPAGGSTPAATADGMVKMAKLGPDKKPLGVPLMVKPTDIKSKQQQGFFVIGEGKEEKKVVHCSQCGKGFSGGGLKAPHQTGFSHCKDHKGMKVIAEDASAGASSAGAIGGGFGNGFANGGPGTISRIKKKKKVSEGGDYGPHSRGVADGYYGRPPNPHKVVTDETGKRMRVKLTDPAEIAEYMAGYKDDSFGSKNYGESKETGPKFTGYWKGKDKQKPGKKMVGGQ